MPSYLSLCHISSMAKASRKSYQIVPQKNLTYGVAISDGISVPSMVTSFATEGEARAWIAEQHDADLRAVASTSRQKPN